MLTGDASVNPDARVICCTAEVLSNMALRRGTAIDVPYARPIPLDTLVMAVAPDSAGRLAREVGGEEFYDRFAGWPETFDYVLMLDFGTPRNPLPGLLEPKASGSYFTLYAITSE